jgi:hypothetical protein
VQAKKNRLEKRFFYASERTEYLSLRASLKTLHIGVIIGSLNWCVNDQKYPASRVSKWLTASDGYSTYHRAAPVWINANTEAKAYEAFA